MAFMRGEYYIYKDIHGYLAMHTPEGNLNLPWEIAEELAVMITERLAAEGADKWISVLRRVHEKYHGNLGADAVSKALGEPTTLDDVREVVANQLERDADVPKRDPGESAKDYIMRTGLMPPKREKNPSPDTDARSEHQATE